MIQFCVTESWKPYFIDLKLMLDTSSSESVCVCIYILFANIARCPVDNAYLEVLLFIYVLHSSVGCQIYSVQS